MGLGLWRVLKRWLVRLNFGRRCPEAVGDPHFAISAKTVRAKRYACANGHQHGSERRDQRKSCLPPLSFNVARHVTGNMLPRAINGRTTDRAKHFCLRSSREAFRKDVSRQLTELQESGGSIEFPSTLNSEERKYIHNLSHQFGSSLCVDAERTEGVP